MGFSRFLMSSRNAAQPGEDDGVLRAETLAGALEMALLA
jgi:hypothetical protein